MQDLELVEECILDGATLALSFNLENGGVNSTYRRGLFARPGFTNSAQSIVSLAQKEVQRG
jgi:hypothetical protein